MKGVCFQGVEAVQLLDLPEPQLVDSTDVIVRVSMAGLCGSDLHPYFGREVGLDVGTVMGHEMVGEVVDVGRDVRQLKLGDTVFSPFTTNCGDCYFCQRGLTARCSRGQLFGWVENGKGLAGCQSEFVRVPLADGTLMKKPEALSAEAALLLGDNLSTGYYCAEMAEIEPDGTYVVVGCGTVGLLCIEAARRLGAKSLFAVDPVPARRNLAESRGAIPLDVGATAREQILQATDGRGAQGVMELVGSPEAQRFAYDVISPGGIMSVVGCHCTDKFSFSPVEAFDKNLTYRVGRCPARHYMGRLASEVTEQDWSLDGLVTHHFSVEECQHAYQVFSSRDEGCQKAVFRF